MRNGVRIKYVSILRGINVSGQKIIKMADLKVLYESLGFEQVQTYIQSGNVVFATKEEHTDDLKELIETAIEHKYSFFVPVLILTAEDVAQLILQCPFHDVDKEAEGSRVLVTVLSAVPEKEKREALQEFSAATERLFTTEQAVYLHCPNGYGKTKLSNTFIESRLGVKATTRNWKTMIKLQELLSA